MTYLFVIIAISVLNALSKDKIGFLELIFANMLIVGGIFLLEKILNLKQESSHQIVYDKIENIHEDNKEELVADLQLRTGRNISRYTIKSIDFSRNVAIINVVYDVNKTGK
jgi:DNA polymerase III gamma/tau subunit